MIHSNYEARNQKSFGLKGFMSQRTTILQCHPIVSTVAAGGKVFTRVEMWRHIAINMSQGVLSGLCQQSGDSASYERYMPE